VAIPVACSLDHGAARAQMQSWRDLVARSIERCDRVTPTRTELLIRSDVTDISALAQLAQLETRCCPFFRFTLEVRATNFVLTIEVPEDAALVLGTFSEEITVGINDGTVPSPD
jgi:hypothetical protein